MTSIQQIKDQIAGIPDEEYGHFDARKTKKCSVYVLDGEGDGDGNFTFLCEGSDLIALADSHTAMQEAISDYVVLAGCSDARCAESNYPQIEAMRSAAGLNDDGFPEQASHR